MELPDPESRIERLGSLLALVRGLVLAPSVKNLVRAQSHLREAVGFAEALPPKRGELERLSSSIRQLQVLLDNAWSFYGGLSLARAGRASLYNSSGLVAAHSRPSMVSLEI